MEKNENKKRKKKFFTMFLLMFATFILLGTSTYAWFTANKNVSVNEITVNVAAQNGIQISADAQNWKSMVQTSDLTGVHTTTYTNSINQLPDTLEPVSTVAAITTAGQMTMWYGVTDSDETTGDMILTATQAVAREDDGAGNPVIEENGKNGKYIAFDLFFKVQQDTPIYLKPEASVTGAQGIQNASRVGFVVLGNKAEGSNAATYQALNNGTNSTVYIWEPNYDVHTDAAVQHAYNTYGITTTTANGTILPYDGVSAAIAASEKVKLGEANKTAHATFFGDNNVTHHTTAATTEQTELFTLTKGITKIRIYMWIEGQDVDCENNASNDDVSFNLKITTETGE